MQCFRREKSRPTVIAHVRYRVSAGRLKSSQYGILSELHSRGAALPTVRELAEELVMDRSTLGQNLRPLERDELITLLTDPNDRRNRLIALTRLGIAKLNDAAKYWKIAQDRFEATFGKLEAADLRSVLFAIAHNPEFAKEKITSTKTSRAKALVRFSRYRVAQEAAREENGIKLEGNRVSASFQGL